jgi:UDP-sulfoquinovose synthase
MSKNVLILGGNGYLGWPTAMSLSKEGYDVSIIDNDIKLKIIKEENITPLYQTLSLKKKCKEWEKVSNIHIKNYNIDLTIFNEFENIIKKIKPDIIIHYAEQPSAPYSMMNFKAAQFTLHNNLNTTMNLIYCVKKYVPECHIIKLGTMGEYGTPNIDIEEGWIDIKHKNREHKFLFPRQGSSLYHTTKIMDTDLLWFYTRNWGLKVTDLMQGPVYGLKSLEMENNNNLLTSFFYDEIFGTVINRFLIQALINLPLTIYGSGKQKRGYLNIIDTLSCVKISCLNPPSSGEMKIYNQFTETFSVTELATKIQKAGEKLNIKVNINYKNNPRKEMEDHYYNPNNSTLKKLGLNPTFLTEDKILEMFHFLLPFKNLINPNIIEKNILWE